MKHHGHECIFASPDVHHPIAPEDLEVVTHVLMLFMLLMSLQKAQEMQGIGASVPVIHQASQFQCMSQIHTS